MNSSRSGLTDKIILGRQELDAVYKRIRKRKLSGLEPDVDEYGIYTPVDTDDIVLEIPKEAVAVSASLFLDIKEKCKNAEILTGGTNIRHLIGGNSHLFGVCMQSGHRLKEVIPLSSIFAQIILKGLYTIHLNAGFTLRIDKSITDRETAITICRVYTGIRYRSNTKIETDKELVGRLAEEALREELEAFFKKYSGERYVFRKSEKKHITDKAAEIIKKACGLSVKAIYAEEDILDYECRKAEVGKTINELIRDSEYLDINTGNLADVLSDVMDRKNAESINDLADRVLEDSIVDIQVCGVLNIIEGFSTIAGNIYLSRMAAVGIDSLGQLRSAYLIDGYVDSADIPVELKKTENEDLIKLLQAEPAEPESMDKGDMLRKLLIMKREWESVDDVAEFISSGECSKGCMTYTRQKSS